MALPARALLEQYVAEGKLMQLATLTDRPSPMVCHLWYHACFDPDRLYFVSRFDRQHSFNIRERTLVGGGIIHLPLEGLGQKVRGATFEGIARELPTVAIDEQIAAFVDRWPAAANLIHPHTLSESQTRSRLYEVSIVSWVLFDEVNFPDEPRQVINAATGR